MKKLFIIFLLIIFNLQIADSFAKNEIKVETLAKASRSWDNKRLPCYPKGQPEVTILKITVPPKSALPAHYHTVINAGYLLKGELTVIKPNGEKLVLKAGDTLIELVNQEHYGANNSEKEVELIVFYAGIKGVPITIKYDKKKD